MGGFGEAQWGFCAVPCRVTQARSGSRCQEKLAWKCCISPRGRAFQTIGNRVLFYSFSLFLSPKPSSRGSQVHPAHPGTRSLPVQEKLAGGHRRGKSSCWRSHRILEESGLLGNGCNPHLCSLNAIPACPAEAAPAPELIPKPARGRSGARDAPGAAPCYQRDLACCQQTGARL